MTRPVRLLLAVAAALLALTPGRAGAGPGHPGVDPALVEEHEAPRLDAGQLGPPFRPRQDEVWPVLLGRAQRLFCA